MNLHNDTFRYVTVSDETEHPQEFLGIRLADPPEVGSEDKIPVFVMFDGRENGFGTTSPQVKELKRLGDGKYGA